MKKTLALATLAAFSSPALAATAKIDTGDTAWMLVATALVLLMTPGLAFFYGGLVRSKTVLNTMMMSFVSMGIVGVLWVLLGYTIAFGADGNALIGSFKALGLNGLNTEVSGTIPSFVFAMFQGMFAIIAPALISGALIDRMRFAPYVLFIALWSLLIYSPLAHWVWDANGWLFKMGALDFAGGTVVHIAAGFSALIAAIVIGPRSTGNRRSGVPHNIPFVLLGAGLLWFGWFGFNAGSALAANQTAALAFLTTNTAAAAGMLAWLVWEMIRGQKPSAVGAATGAVVGLVAITPACAFVSPVAAIAVGLLGASAAFWAVQLKHRFSADDALDVFACHGVGGIVGALLTGVFAFTTGAGKDVLTQIGIQTIGILATMAFVGIGTFVILKVIALIFGDLRISSREENLGTDLSSHQEEGYASEDFGFSSKESTPLSSPVILNSND